jgi:hypothetical protein
MTVSSSVSRCQAGFSSGGFLGILGTIEGHSLNSLATEFCEKGRPAKPAKPRKKKMTRALELLLSCYWHRRSLEMWTKIAVLFSMSRVKSGIYLREWISIFQNFEGIWA